MNGVVFDAGSIVIGHCDCRWSDLLEVRRSRLFRNVVLDLEQPILKSRVCPSLGYLYELRYWRQGVEQTQVWSGKGLLLGGPSHGLSESSRDPLLVGRKMWAPTTGRYLETSFCRPLENSGGDRRFHVVCAEE